VTLLVAVCPAVLVFWLRGAGVIGSVPAAIVLAAAVSLGLSWAGSQYWRRRSNQELVFGELPIWGFARRWRAERRINSARRLLGRGDTVHRRLQAIELTRLVSALEAADAYSNGHSRRVARHAWMIAKHMGLSLAEVNTIRVAAAVHDVGKVHTPTAVLHKPGALDDAEFEVIKRHPVDGAEMVARLGDDELTAFVRHHHERLDGSGYPGGLRGERIPLGARIIAVADTFDAITSSRSYRRALPHRKALDILEREAGTQLDAGAVDAFRAYYDGRRSTATWSTLTNLPAQMPGSISAGIASVVPAVKVAIAAAALSGVVAVAAPVKVLTRAAPPKSELAVNAVPHPNPEKLLRPSSSAQTTHHSHVSRANPAPSGSSSAGRALVPVQGTRQPSVPVAYTAPAESAPAPIRATPSRPPENTKPVVRSGPGAAPVTTPPPTQSPPPAGSNGIPIVTPLLQEAVRVVHTVSCTVNLCVAQKR
jgi:hypothetical protein